ncbi:MAG: penicillin-binding protein 2 [Rhodobacteraceae bacterium]|jgi:cell division protein FtsI (penicillin-binding protein 3)|uniref:Cell division protein FtsI (Penicillin-binding protein 3) n=1 Tax=Salipiger profundus TaxID=1229727 RepID=A0A1U7DCG0_9RHOB|nr:MULTISPECIES: penicillin-binding protein 2 [Salipiger]APX25735.1 cell division protein FtsI (penicillin-binding protein 3) [Salipiger profundus]MAB06410.1 penicillin-binding protein 2 [Paracoccaceae bacterium]GGA03753.1 cell division protein FtsI [Salipiger profundus]SFD57240.1 cell division protein FtsI (penicillin-binding protein 3) [Salipiger profundus]
MTRTPLRPLARILEARQRGENPDAIERENIRIRHEQMRDKARVRAEGRLLVLGVLFFLAFGTIGARMGLLAASEPSEPRARASGASILASRADITDRRGRVLATNMETHSLYAHPQQMIEPIRAADELMKIFPDLDRERMVKDFTDPKRKFLWVKKKISPEQMQAVHDIGEPGLLFGPREMRLYPNGALAAHVLGGASFGREGVASAEVIGTAGLEKYFDKELRDPAREGAPLELSIDLTVQAATERVLDAGMRLLNAKGAASVLMDVHTGEVIAIASLPDFDPNDRPRAPISGSPSDSPLFNRAVQGVYELGSTFKIFAAAQAMEMGLVTPDTMIDTRPPFKVGGHRIGEFEGHNYGEIPVEEIIIKSSNRGTGKLALAIGIERQQEFLKSLGFFEPTKLEIVEAAGGQPLLPSRWTDLSSVTISYGHGLSSSPLHLAAAYSTIANGGRQVTPTLLKRNGPQLGPRILSEEVSSEARTMLRKVVSEGTASFGEVPGYNVGGKTGTADKPKENGGGYYKDKVIATFASMFPAEDPKYVLIVTLDEPVETAGDRPRRTAGWTAVPVAAEMIGRIAPLLGLRPQYDVSDMAGVTLVRQ